jgi:hypothetical protein
VPWGNALLPVSLPMGDETHDWTLTVVGRVTDRYGAYADVEVDIVVCMVTLWGVRGRGGGHCGMYGDAMGRTRTWRWTLWYVW